MRPGWQPGRLASSRWSCQHLSSRVRVRSVLQAEAGPPRRQLDQREAAGRGGGRGLPEDGAGAVAQHCQHQEPAGLRQHRGAHQPGVQPRWCALAPAPTPLLFPSSSVPKRSPTHRPLPHLSFSSDEVCQSLWMTHHIPYWTPSETTFASCTAMVLTASNTLMATVMLHLHGDTLAPWQPCS